MAEETVPSGDFVYIRAVKNATEPVTTVSTTPADSAVINTTESLETIPAEQESSPAQPEVIPLGLVREPGGLYYYAQPGVRFQGWLQTELGYCYFDEARVSGLYEINGDTYYFLNGYMTTGIQTIRGVEMEFDETTGKRLWVGSPFHLRQGVVDGILYDQGQICSGYVSVDGQWFLADQTGHIITGRQLVNGQWRFFKEDGTQAYGFVEGAGGNCYFANENGILESGFVFSGGVLRYFDPSTLAMVRNSSIGLFQVDGSGRCIRQSVEVSDANLDAYVDSILAEIGTTPRAIYEYVSKNYVYVVQGWDSNRNMAIHMFNKGYGACIHFCAITEMLLNRAGYATHWVRGEQGHYWLLVEMSPGVWRHMDTMRKNHNVFNLTDDELWAKHDGPYGIAAGVNFHWDRSQWTSTTTTGLGGGPSAAATTAVPETTEALETTEDTTVPKETPAAVETTSETETTISPETTVPPVTETVETTVESGEETSAP